MNHPRLRLLVAIASFGEKNLGFLKKIIKGYRSMPIDVDVVVLSDAPKNLGSEVKVMVGMPSKDPWSLPFAHKPVLADNADKYDLFIYSEDDMEVTERNIQAFLDITPQLAPTEIAGFLRYETNNSGTLSFPDMHGIYRWKPETVKRRGDCTIAEFTNEHAAFYILTKEQLKQAIVSGGFLRLPTRGRYDMACTAATDPYTSCGFKKVVCISAWQDFVIHHMSNRYVGQFGLPLNSFKEQIQTLMEICGGIHPASSLCGSESKLFYPKWSANYYEKPHDELLRAVPVDTKTILSIGCGWGAAEKRLQQRGVEVTALPLDSIIGAAAARLGITVIYGTLNESLASLEEQRFDCVLISNLLHLQSNPEQILQRCCQLVRMGGVLVVSSPNFDRIPVMLRRAFAVGDYSKLRNFSLGGISPCEINFMKQKLKQLGFRTDRVQWFDRMPPHKFAAIRKYLGRFAAADWVLKAHRSVLK
jgi:2-polyprenyl-3-methyl-5-hydroxy-6-metoxy-1,4-benzoquinol methylase